MKMQRTQYPRVLVSAGVLLVGVLTVWYFARGVSARKVVATPAAEMTSASVAKPPLRHSSKPSGVLPGQRPAPALSTTSGQNLSGSNGAFPSQLPAPSFLAPPLSRDDVAAALAAILNEPEAEMQEEALENLVERIVAGNLSDAVSFVLGQRGSAMHHDLGLRLLRRWTGNDPQAAAAWVSQSAMDSGRQEAINAVAIAWANQDRVAAIAWVRQLPTEAERQGGLLSVAYEAARTEPLEALNLANILPPGKAQDDLLTHAANQWATSAPEAAAAWAKGIPDAALRERALTVIATAWGETSPLAAATLAMQSLTLGRPQDDAVVGIVQRWVQKEPEQAAAWVAAFPGREVRDAAVENLVRLWADQDLEHVGQWVASLQVGEMRDVAIGTYVSKLALRDPEVASRWAEDIEDQAIREREMVGVGEAWMGNDAPAARAWILQTSLPDTTKERLFALNPD